MSEPPVCAECGKPLGVLVAWETDPSSRFGTEYAWNGVRYVATGNYYKPKKEHQGSRYLRCGECKWKVGQSATIRARKLGVSQWKAR